MVEEFSILDSSSDGSRQWWELSQDGNCQFEFSTLQQGRSQGVQMLKSHVGCVKLDLILSRAANIGYLEFNGVSVGWRSPIQGPVHPHFVPLYRPDGLGWLEGFDEVLARCGLGNVGGPEFNERHQLVQPLHGALSNQPCRSAKAIVDRQKREVVFETETEECVFHFNRLTVVSQTIVSMDEPKVTVRDRIENRGARTAEILLLHHWNFGPPILGPAARIYVGHAELAPRNATAAGQVSGWDRMPPPAPETEETVYFFRPEADAQGFSSALLCDENQENGVQMNWKMESMPCFTLWRNPVAESDGYALGLEPGTCYPNSRTHEQQVGRAVKLKPGDSHSVEVSLRGWINDSDGLAQEVDRVQNLSASAIKHSSPCDSFGPV